MPAGKLECSWALPRRKRTSERWKDRGRGLLTAALSLCCWVGPSSRQESIHSFILQPNKGLLSAHSVPGHSMSQVDDPTLEDGQCWGAVCVCVWGQFSFWGLKMGGSCDTPERSRARPRGHGWGASRRC